MANLTFVASFKGTTTTKFGYRTTFGKWESIRSDFSKYGNTPRVQVLGAFDEAKDAKEHAEEEASAFADWLAGR